MQEGKRGERRRRRNVEGWAKRFPKGKKKKRMRSREVGREGPREFRVLIGPWAPGHAATTSKVRYTSSAAGKR